MKPCRVCTIWEEKMCAIVLYVVIASWYPTYMSGDHHLCTLLLLSEIL